MVPSAHSWMVGRSEDIERPAVGRRTFGLLLPHIASLPAYEVIMERAQGSRPGSV